jgi:hypothetical protein
MKAELNIGILAETLTLLYGEASAANVSRVYTTIARLQAEADMEGFKRGYQQAELDAREAEDFLGTTNPQTVNAFQQRLEKEPNVVALCGTRLGDDELFQRDSGDETDYD